MGLIKSRTCPPIHLCQTSRNSRAGSSRATVSLPVEAMILSFLLLIRPGLTLTPRARYASLNLIASLWIISHWDWGTAWELAFRGVQRIEPWSSCVIVYYSVWRPSSLFKSEVPTRILGSQTFCCHIMALPPACSPSPIGRLTGC